MELKTYILLLLGLPLITAILARVLKNDNLRNNIVVLNAGLLFICVLKLFSYEGAQVEFFKIFDAVPIAFSIDKLTLIFLSIASFLYLVTSLYAIGYLDETKDKNKPRFTSFFAIAISATMGLATSDNLLTLFLFYEILTLSTFPLVAHTESRNALKSGRVYLGFLLGTSIFLFLPAIIYTYILAGDLTFVSGGLLNGKLDANSAGILVALFFFGIGKLALIPIHKWLPAAMVAPTPVSALLHAVAVVKAGAFTIIKIAIFVIGYENISEILFYNFWAGEWIVYVCCASILLASYFALKQDNLKLRLAFSTVSQLSYIALGAALFSKAGLIAAIFHIIAHAFSKITLFFSAGYIYAITGKTKVSELSGLAKKMPTISIAFSIAALSMIGIPPLVGFVTKYYLISGAFEYGGTYTATYFVLATLIASTLLNCSYFLPIIFNFYYGESDNSRKALPSNNLMLVPIIICATASVLLFFVSTPILEFIEGIFN